MSKVNNEYIRKTFTEVNLSLFLTFSRYVPPVQINLKPASSLASLSQP